MKLKTNIKWLLALSLVFISGNFLRANEPDTVKIRQVIEHASNLYSEGVLDSSQLLAGRANAEVTKLLYAEEVQYDEAILDQMKLLKARALNILALSIESAEPQAAIDSLQLAIELMEETGNIVEKANLYSSMAMVYDFQAQNEVALEYHTMSIALYREAGNMEGQAMALTNMGITYRNMGNYGEAMEVLLESLDLYRNLNDSINVVETLLAMGFVYMYVDRWDGALDAQEQALEIYRNRNDSLGIARIYNDMGALNMSAGNYQEALELHQAALKIRLNSNEFYYTFASYYYIATIYERFEQFDEALDHYESALQYAERTGSKISIIDAYNGIGDIHFKTGNYKQALEQYKMAEMLSREIKDGTGRAQAFMKIAKIYDIQNNPAKALANLKLAEDAVPNSSTIFLEEIYFGIAKAYEQLGDYKNAFINMELYGQVKDSVTKAENLEKVTALTNRLEFENRQALQRESQEKMIQVKQAEINRQKILRNFILFGMFAILVLAVIFYIRFVEKNKLNKKLNRALNDLQSTQVQLIHAEKMASLGELSAGIAHEIQNPLNFVNNFSEVSTDLIRELTEELNTGNTEEIKAIAGDLLLNLEKINHHGNRASNIVKSMLEHSRTGSGKKQNTDLNVLADEYLRLAYHGLRAKDKAFNAAFNLVPDPNLPQINVLPQDIGRVLLNLFNNAFFSVNEKSKENIEGYKPEVVVSTSTTDQKVEILIKDNGTGISEDIKDKVFQPFFTTKPTGEGTGLGLSLSYDIITKGHGGELRLKTEEGTGTAITIILPIN